MFTRMSRFTCVSTFMVLLLVSVSLPAFSASEWTVDSIRSFVVDEFPDVSGTIVSSDESGVFFVETQEAVPSGTVEIYRKKASKSDQGPRLTTNVLGVGRISSSSEGVAKLKVSDELSQGIQNGDRVRLASRPLLVENRTSVPTEKLSNTLSTLKQIKSVVPYADKKSLEKKKRNKSFVLTIKAKRLELKRHGEWGTIADRSLRTPRASGKKRKRMQTQTTQPKPVKQFVLKKSVQDFDWITFPQNQSVKILAAGSKRKLGIARWQDSIRGMKWHHVPGNVLNVSLVKPANSPRSEISVIVVLKDDDTIYTHFYTYGLQNRKLREIWKSKDIWMRQLGSEFYAFRIGLNEVFKKYIYPVELTKESWDWASTDNQYLPKGASLSSYDKIDDWVFRINRTGRLEVFRGQKKVLNTGGGYGKSPYQITARRGKQNVRIQPGISVWKANDSEYNVILQRNKTSGVPYLSAFQSYSDARLYWLQINRDRIEEKWESSRFPGYFSRINRLGSTVWASLVRSEGNKTTFYTIENISGFTQSKPSKTSPTKSQENVPSGSPDASPMVR